MTTQPQSWIYIYIYIYLVTLGCKNFLNKNFCPTLNISFFFFMFYQCKMSCVWIIKKGGGGGIKDVWEIVTVEHI